MSLHSGMSNDSPLTHEELYDLITYDSLTELTNRINNDNLLTPEMLQDLLSKRNIFQFNVSDFAISLGRLDILKVFVAKGAPLNDINASGYTNAHYAVCWNRLAELKFIYDKGADLHCLTGKNEDTIKMARRLNYLEIIEFLEWAYSRDTLINYIDESRNAVNNADKSKITKDDKKLCDSVCTDKENWMKNNPNATMQELKDRLDECQSMLEEIWTKLNEVVEE